MSLQCIDPNIKPLKLKKNLILFFIFCVPTVYYHNDWLKNTNSTGCLTSVYSKIKNFYSWHVVKKQLVCVWLLKLSLREETKAALSYAVCEHCLTWPAACFPTCWSAACLLLKNIHVTFRILLQKKLIIVFHLHLWHLIGTTDVISRHFVMFLIHSHCTRMSHTLNCLTFQ